MTYALRDASVTEVDAERSLDPLEHGAGSSTVAAWCTYSLMSQGARADSLPVNCISRRMARAYCRQ